MSQKLKDQKGLLWIIILNNKLGNLEMDKFLETHSLPGSNQETENLKIVLSVGIRGHGEIFFIFSRNWENTTVRLNVPCEVLEIGGKIN